MISPVRCSEGEIFVLDLGGLSNATSIRNALRYMGYSHVSGLLDKRNVRKVRGLIIPGVASFAAWMDAASVTGQDLLIREVVSSGRPILGICLGMQVLFSEGMEGRPCKGLGLLEGVVAPLTNASQRSYGLNVGWSTILPAHDPMCAKPSDFLMATKDSDYFYFSHRFFVDAADPIDITAVTTFFDQSIPAVVQKENIFGVQFHPERSDKAGRNLLDRFVRMIESDT